MHAVRGHQRRHGDVLPSLRRAARRACSNGRRRCSASGRDLGCEITGADQTLGAAGEGDGFAGNRRERETRGGLTPGTGIGGRAPQCVLARFDASCRSGARDERRGNASIRPSGRRAAAARGKRHAGHRCRRDGAESSAARPARRISRSVSAAGRRWRLLRLRAHDGPQCGAGLRADRNHATDGSTCGARRGSACGGICTIIVSAIGQHRAAAFDISAGGNRGATRTAGCPTLCTYGCGCGDAGRGNNSGRGRTAVRGRDVRCRYPGVTRCVSTDGTRSTFDPCKRSARAGSSGRSPPRVGSNGTGATPARD